MATLNDIAEACGVSKATVSRVLNQDPEFSRGRGNPEKKFLSTAAEMNYEMGKKASVCEHPEKAGTGRSTKADTGNRTGNEDRNSGVWFSEK